MESEGSDGVTILHVDDDPALGGLVKTFLEREASGLECRVLSETSPVDALERLDDGEGIDCVISDYRMPGMNGIEFLETVREDHPELPVLLFSGEETNAVAAEIIHAGLTDYLRKGMGTDQYTMLIRRVGHAVDSDGRFDPAAETELDGVGVVGSDEFFERADETYASCYGYAPDDVAGKHWTELHPEWEVEHIRTHVLPVVREQGTWSGRSEGLRSDGSTFVESKLVSALDDGRLMIAVSELDESHVENAA
ncbi:response regulator [Halalkalicoccus jeotgali]|uniref:HTR-like protein n=1 Tax=Halalkalicoccus jeotgali (strain DSM 18796 / CECT 7217 / JCM 14584 / KCTC 4019 / B3) TaxID=795797 RepID=D8JA29_HALJB|nr:response regulator [Halalkalicoccus jeotgali]ADJ14551.1 HTR-like protein [Halalkalicoccus jeotgali B3]ELY39923.1 HTR-like protein [Halalkalicoccus jeotgali B3]